MKAEGTRSRRASSIRSRQYARGTFALILNSKMPTGLMMNSIQFRTGLRTLSGMLAGGTLAFSLAACDTDKIVKVEDPAQLHPTATATAAAVPALVNGAFRQFVG